MTGFEALLADLREGEEITFRRGYPSCNGFGIAGEIIATRSTGIAKKPQDEFARGYGPGRHKRVGRTFCFQVDSPARFEILNEAMRHLRFALQECREELEKEG